MASEIENGELQVACCLPVPGTSIFDLPSRNLRPAGDGREQSLAVGKEWFWGNGTSIHVRFLNRNADLEPVIEEAAEVWARYANVRFVFDNSSSAQVRVLFDEKIHGGRSMLGKLDHEKAPQGKPTMTLGTKLSKESFRRTALHELGHVLGCIHEHCSPVANIQWNKNAVIEWYRREDPAYTEEWVEENIFQKYPSDAFETTSFDQKSIMVYPILPEWATNIKMIDWPHELSPADKMLIGRVYPPIMSTEGVTYHTMETRDWSKPEVDNVKKVRITNPHRKELDLAIGITHFDLKGKNNMNLAAYARSWDDTTRSIFDLHLHSKEGTTMFSSGATYMLAERYTARLQMGSYVTRNADLISDDGEKEYKGRINFNQSFNETPSVVVWLQAFDFEKGGSYSINAYTEGIDRHGFYVRVDALHGARLHTASVSWVAYEKDPAGIKSGRFSFESFKKRPDNDSKLPPRHCVREEMLGEWQLTRLYTGLSKFRFDPRTNARIAVNVECAKSSFKIDFNTWWDSVCDGVEVSYIAVCI